MKSVCLVKAGKADKSKIIRKLSAAPKQARQTKPGIMENCLPRASRQGRRKQEILKSVCHGKDGKADKSRNYWNLSAVSKQARQTKARL